MTKAESIHGDLQMGMKLLAFKPVSLPFAPMAMAWVDDTLKAEGWEPITAMKENADGTEFSRYYYGSMQKSYAQAVCKGSTGLCEIHSAEENGLLESMSFAELQHLGNLLDKKTVAFIRIYSEKELASAKTDEERKALTERNEKMIAEAEVALRKR